MTRLRPIAVIATLLLVSLFGSVAWPQTDSARSDADRARSHFKQGADFYFESEFEAALNEFRQGHRIVPNALFVYNMMLCNFRLGRLERALKDGLEARRLGTLPTDESTKNESRIAAISVVLEARETTRAKPTRSAVSNLETEESEVTEVSDESPLLGTGGWIGAGMMGAGAVALASTLLINSSINSAWDDYSAALAQSDFESARENQSKIEQNQTIGKVAFFSGVGLSVAGAILLTLDLLDSEESPTVGVAPSTDGMSVQTRFEF